MYFVIEFFLTVTFYQFFKNHWFPYIMAYFSRKIFSITLLFIFLTVKFPMAEIVETIFFKITIRRLFTNFQNWKQ